MYNKSQQSLTSQLQELIRLANNNGLYDAADWLQMHMVGAKKIVSLTEQLGRLTNIRR